MDLGGSWAPFGKGLGRSGASFGRSWALFGSFFGLLNTSSIMILPKMGSKEASGSILGGICKDFGRIWEGFGKVLGRICEDFGRFEHIVGRFWIFFT